MALIIMFVFLIISATTATPLPTPPSPAAVELQAAYDARRLINSSVWGVVSSLNYKNGNSPFGNILSYSDGGRGTPYFYLTLLDGAIANFSGADARSSLTVGQFALGTCGIQDPQEPSCAKVTLTGLLQKLDPSSKEGKFANATLFERHPRFSKLPPVAKFQLYKLKISEVFVLNTYGDPKYPTVKSYYSVRL
ncbi:hypothetical protein ACP275_08G016400 [Erythranthe tilingii]